jgi:Domain of unknown function (DUF6265)
MKRSIVLLTALLCFGRNYSQPSSKLTDFKKLYWLEGTWVRTNIKPGHSGNERWVKISPTELQGTGVSMKGTDTAFVEKFKLVIKNNTIYYVADVPENKQPVDFKLTEISEKEFSCENPEHDFPKKIRYRKDGNIITATISGNGKSVDYLFEKK